MRLWLVLLQFLYRSHQKLAYCLLDLPLNESKKKKRILF
jgi:hypothetical protein